MDYCHSYLGFHSKFNTWLGMPFFIARDFSKKSPCYRILSYCYQYITETLQVLGVVSGLIALPLVSYEMNILAACLASTTHGAQVLAKTIMLEIKAGEFLLHLQRFDRVLENNNPLRKLAGVEEDFQTFSRKISRYVRIVEPIYFFIQVMTTSLYFVPFVINSIYNYDTIDQQILPIVGYFPFECYVTPTFQLVIIFQNICYYYYNVKTVVIDMFMLGLIVLHSSQFRYLNELMKAFVERMGTNQPTKEEEFFLRAWIVQHEQSLQIAKSFKDLMTPYIFMQYTYILIHTCVPAFVITSTLSWNLTQKIALVFMVSAGIVTIYLLSAAGDELTISSEKPITTFYSSHLFRAKSGFHQTLKKVLTMRMRIRPISLNVLTLFPLCSATFGSIMRLVVTYYMALNEIQKIKDSN